MLFQKRIQVVSLIYLPTLALLFGAGLIALFTPIPATTLIHDTTAIAEVPFYYGALSVVGILLWGSTAAVCLLTFLVLRVSDQQKQVRSFFLFAGLFTLWMTVDDAFLVHEVVGPDYLGIAGEFFYVAYALLALWIFVAYREFILANDIFILLLSMSFFASSVLMDVAHDNLGLRVYKSDFWEDACKLLGIAGWLGYFVCVSVNQLAELAEEADI